MKEEKVTQMQKDNKAVTPKFRGKKYLQLEFY